MTKQNSFDSVPQLKLKGEDFSHIVPEEHSLTLFIEFKKGGTPRDEIANVRAFQKEGKELRVVNRHTNYKYIYNLKEVKKVYVLFDVDLKEE